MKTVKMTRQDKIDNTINVIKNTNGVTNFKCEEYKGLLIFTYNRNVSDIIVGYFSGKSSKIKSHYKFHSIETSMNYINNLKKDADITETNELDYINGFIKEFSKLEIGSILYTSWGYEQTNINFYQIVDIKGKTLKIQEINYNSTDITSMSCKKSPIKDTMHGEVHTVRYGKYGSKINSNNLGLVECGKSYYSSSYA